MILRVFLLLYRFVWVPLTPVVLIYLWQRGRRDAAYSQHLGERFGFYGKPLPQNPIWFHAVSLGETRSAVPLIRLLLDRGETVLLTHFTPAGRRESLRQFGPEIASGQLAAIWAPLDMWWCYARLFHACRPRLGLTMEIEIWPAMIFAAKAHGVPLYMCNAQYPVESMERDARWLGLRQKVIAGFAGGFVKSELQAQRFRAIGARNIHVTGELRFDQPVLPVLLDAAARAWPLLAAKRPVFTIASAVKGEDALYIDTILALRDAAQGEPPLFVYVPRAPERFDEVAQMLEAAGLHVLRRSQIAPEGAEGLLALQMPDGTAPDVLLGDSLGEMYFYLALADRVVVGGGFNRRGAHNVIEPLSLMKPVLVGPHVWTIAYPFAEAEAAGVAVSVADGPALTAALAVPDTTDRAQITAFLDAHSGASRRTLAAIDAVLGERD